MQTKCSTGNVSKGSCIVLGLTASIRPRYCDDGYVCPGNPAWRPVNRALRETASYGVLEAWLGDFVPRENYERLFPACR